MSNVIFIKFANKSKFPNGIWNKEPDFCEWEMNNLLCLAIRNMSFGFWTGYVGLPDTHILYNKNYNDLINCDMKLDVYGGISLVGKLPKQFDKYNDRWWIGFETSQDIDLIPILTYDNFDKKISYKNFKFILKEINRIAFLLNKIF